jgi:hypothetical protein
MRVAVLLPATPIAQVDHSHPTSSEATELLPTGIAAAVSERHQWVHRATAFPQSIPTPHRWRHVLRRRSLFSGGCAGKIFARVSANRKTVLVLGAGLGSIVQVMRARGYAPNYTLVEKDETVLGWAIEPLGKGNPPKLEPVCRDSRISAQLKSWRIWHHGKPTSRGHPAHQAYNAFAHFAAECQGRTLHPCCSAVSPPP